MSGPSASVEEVIHEALSQVGVGETPPGSNNTPYGAWYGLNGNAWCAMFVSWCFAMAGCPLPQRYAYCPAGVAWAKANGCWHDASSGYTPKRGDIIFFSWDGVRAEHTGIVLGLLLGGTHVQTVEGNTSDMVMIRNRSRSGGGTIGYLEVSDVAAPVPVGPPPWPGRILRRADHVHDHEAFAWKLLLVDAGFGQHCSFKPDEFDVFGSGTEADTERLQVYHDQLATLAGNPTWGTPDKEVGPLTWAFAIWCAQHR